MAVVNLMKLGPNGNMHAPGLNITPIRNNMKRALLLSGGKATTYPIDHIEEHGASHYFIRGMFQSFKPAAVVEVAQEGKVMSMAVLPGLGRAVHQIDKDMPLIWKLNRGSGEKVNGDYTTVREYSNIDDAMKIAVDNGAAFWGATFYNGSDNAIDMIRQLAEMDEAGAKHGLGGVVWNYPRGNDIASGHDAFIFYQLDGFERIINACPNSLVLVKEKISTPAGTVEQWKEGELAKIGRGKGALGKPGEKGINDDEIRFLLGLTRAEQIKYMVRWQQSFGIASLMSGGDPQAPEKFITDVEDGIGSDRHIAFIAGRSTTKQIVDKDGKYDISGAVAHFTMLNEAAPTVIIKD